MKIPFRIIGAFVGCTPDPDKCNWTGPVALSLFPRPFRAW